MSGSDDRRWWALAGLLVAVLTVGFDITIMNVALPTIATALEVGTDGLQWMVNAYVLVLAGLMLACGALGDRYGRKKLLQIGLALFGLASGGDGRRRGDHPAGGVRRAAGPVRTPRARQGGVRG